MSKTFLNVTDADGDVDADDHKIKVFLRLKNEVVSSLYEVEDKVITCRSVNVEDAERLDKQFTFTHIFAPETQQPEIFETVVKPRICNFINGQNTTVLCYGASGAGKTYTAMGKVNAPGIIPRSLDYIFRVLPEVRSEPRYKLTNCGNLKPCDNNETDVLKELLFNNPDNKTFNMMRQAMDSEEIVTEMPEGLSLGVWVSFAEIYNENISDLLETKSSRWKPKKKLKLMNNNGMTYVQNLTNVYVPSALTAYQVFQCGMSKLKYASTSMNSRSSRSHCIFTVKLVQKSEEQVKVSSFNFCDLAGVERAKHTHNVGERLKEANNINTSLMVLGRCLQILREVRSDSGKKLVPFRESKLTQLLKRSLLGYEDIAIIVNVNPVEEYHGENMHVLNFSAVAKDILVTQRKLSVNSVVFLDNDDHQLEKLVEQISEQREVIKQLMEEYKILEAESEAKDWTIRRELVQEFQRMIADIKQEHAEEISEYKQSLFDLRNKYEDLINSTGCDSPKVEEEEDLEDSEEYSGDSDSSDDVVCLDSSVALIEID